MCKFSLTSAIEFFSPWLWVAFFTQTTYLADFSKWLMQTCLVLHSYAVFCHVKGVSCLTNSLLTRCVSWFEIFFIIKTYSPILVVSYSKCGPWPGSLGRTWGLVRNTDPQAHPWSADPMHISAWLALPWHVSPAHCPRGLRQSAVVAVLQGSTAWDRLRLG